MKNEIETPGPIVAPIGPEQEKLLIEAAALDKHTVVAPTHIVVKDDLVAGYLSLGLVPMVMLWFHSAVMKARDSLTVAQVFENVLRAQGETAVAVPVPESSTLYPYMTKLGYVDAGTVHVFVKKLN